jgi:hypothetical protein
MMDGMMDWMMTGMWLWGLAGLLVNTGFDISINGSPDLTRAIGDGSIDPSRS